MLEKSISESGRNEIVDSVEKESIRLTEDLKVEVQKDMKSQLEKLEDKYGFEIPWSEVFTKLNMIEFKSHLSQAQAAWASWQAAHAILNDVGSTPSMSHEELHRIDLENGMKIHLTSGLMFPPRVSPNCVLYFAYIIDGFREDVNLFEEAEQMLPNAGYRCLIPPGLQSSSVAESFFTKPVRCLKNVEEFRDAVKKYFVFDRGYRGKSVYSIQVKIADVLLDLEFWLDWKPKRLEILKHMNQDLSLPPSKVMDYLEREEDMEVMALRIPRWLKKKLEDEAEKREEQPSTYLRNKLEDLYK